MYKREKVSHYVFLDVVPRSVGKRIIHIVRPIYSDLFDNYDFMSLAISECESVKRKYPRCLVFIAKICAECSCVEVN